MLIDQMLDTNGATTIIIKKHKWLQDMGDESGNQRGNATSTTQGHLSTGHTYTNTSSF